jgi:SNF2 family DNA or RNA helicase
MSEEFEKLKIENYSEVFRDFKKMNRDDVNKRKRMKLSEQDQYIQRLKKILEPFLLRRLKKEVYFLLSVLFSL